MFTLTTSTGGRVLRSGLPVTASQALRDWFAEESTGYDVACRDDSGTAMTKAQLRVIARSAGLPTPA